MEIKVNKLLTEKGRQEAKYWASLINQELSIYDFIIFNQMQLFATEAIEIAKKLGVYKQMTKKTLNTIKDNVDKLVIACQTSEKTEFMDLVVSPFPNYRYDYMREGGYFLQDVCSKWKKSNDTKFFLLDNALKNCFSFYNVKNIELVVIMYKLRIMCEILDAICSFQRKRLMNNTGIDVEEMRMRRYITVEKNVINLCKSMFDYNRVNDTHDDNIHFGSQAILNNTMNDTCGEIIGKSLNDTIVDYSNYCLARMLLDVRSKKAINEDDYDTLVHMGFTSQFVDKIVEELKKTHVGEKETDPCELKLMIYRIKYCKHLNLFIKAMVSVTKEIKQAG